MEARELRIGNLVDYFEEKDSYSKIESISKNMCHFDNASSIEFPFIKPIPLTEEWLLEFGFKKVYGLYCKSLHNGAFAIEPSDNSFGLYSSDHLFKVGTSYSNDHKIKHVHQLQNLYFALTGKELEINE